MAKGLLCLTSYFGIREIISRTWQFFERLELGYTIETSTDYVICSLISALIVMALMVCSEG